jgi:phospholipid/cholesterol/gamma-HCH transport system permease protein
MWLILSALRELGILLTAIMVAGRSGSAFTAQIGSMRLQEEVDAMETIGLDPVDVLVIPRVLSLVLLMPLLGFYASMMALAGGALFTWFQLDIPISTFIQRLQEAVTMDHFWVGMIKAPVFGLIIGVVGCFEGMQVEGGAQSVGEHTTRSVVVSIFMVIVVDAMFAVFFTSIGW